MINNIGMDRSIEYIDRIKLTYENLRSVSILNIKVIDIDRISLEEAIEFYKLGLEFRVNDGSIRGLTR